MKIVLTLLAFAMSVAAAAAGSVKIGDISIDNAWARATPKGAEVGAGYLTIRNDGATPDRLIGISADFASVEVHEMKTSNGVMEMREVTGGVEIPAHGSVKFAPNGYHLMFVGLKKPLVKGESVRTTFSFEHAGQGAVDLRVMGAGASGPEGATAPMKGM